jgi:hypothetical protein
MLSRGLVVPPNCDIDNGIDVRLSAGPYHSPDQIGLQMGMGHSRLCWVETPPMVTHGKKVDRIDSGDPKRLGELLFVKVYANLGNVLRGVKVEMNLSEEGSNLFHVWLLSILMFYYNAAAFATGSDIMM